MWLIEITAACYLAMVPVVGCDSRAQVHRQAVEALPPAHWRTVEFLMHCQSCTRSAAFRGGLVELKAGAKPRTVWHEVGHTVSFTADSHLLNLWTARLWRDYVPALRDPYSNDGLTEQRGQSVGRVVSDYASTTPEEDFAEHYAAYMADDLACCSERRAWLARHVFGPWRVSRDLALPGG